MAKNMSLESRVRSSVAGSIAKGVVGAVAGLSLAYCAMAYGDDKKRLDLPVDKPEQGRALQPKKPKPEPSPLDEMLPPEEISAEKPISEKSKPVEFWGEKIFETKSIIYVIDISGSMNLLVDDYVDRDGKIASGSRLDRAKDVLIKSINGLPENMEFAIVAYAAPTSQRGFPGPIDKCEDKNEPYVAFRKNFFDPPIIKYRIIIDSGDIGKKLVASEENKKYACDWITSLKSLGATGTGPAVAVALSDKKNDTIILLSDGLPNFPIYFKINKYDFFPVIKNRYEWHLKRILEARKRDEKIYTFGFDVSGDTAKFMMDIAANTGGKYTPVK